LSLRSQKYGFGIRYPGSGFDMEKIRIRVGKNSGSIWKKFGSGIRDPGSIWKKFGSGLVKIRITVWYVRYGSGSFYLYTTMSATLASCRSYEKLPVKAVRSKEARAVILPVPRYANRHASGSNVAQDPGLHVKYSC
jgi:hypothetical protein